MLSIGGDDETHLTFKTRLVPVHSAGEVRVLPPGSARFPSLGEWSWGKLRRRAPRNALCFR